MLTRTQILLDSHALKEARRRAAESGISLAEYVRRLVARDLGGAARVADPSLVFNLGDSGGSDVARRKDAMVAEALAAERGARRAPR